MASEGPAPKQRRKPPGLTGEERIFRAALGVLRYGSAGDWLPLEALHGRLRLKHMALPQLRALLEADATRVDCFSWRELTWVRAKPREPDKQRWQAATTAAAAAAAATPSLPTS